MKVLVVVGTRPEVIKLAPLLDELRSRRIRTILVATGQHVEMLPAFLEEFHLAADLACERRSADVSISEFLGQVTSELSRTITAQGPDLVLVHGDTSSALAGALAGFYSRTPVAHLEAGLRSPVLTQPFPEEGNRRAIDHLSSILLAPTRLAARNLRQEGIAADQIYVTGNTVVDALRAATDGDAYASLRRAGPQVEVPTSWLVTLHRRESWDEGIASICRGLESALQRYARMSVVFPVHPNPTVSEKVQQLLGHQNRVTLTDPLGYHELVRYLSSSDAVLTDSGGIQEEATALGRPVVVARELTERPEVLHVGRGILAGTTGQGVFAAISKVMLPETYVQMAQPSDVYGDGKAAARCADALLHALTGSARPEDFQPTDDIPTDVMVSTVFDDNDPSQMSFPADHLRDI